MTHVDTDIDLALVDPPPLPPPVFVPARRVPWTPIALGLAGAVIGALISAIAAVLDGRTGTAWVAAGAMALLGIALFPVLTHLEMDR